MSSFHAFPDPSTEASLAEARISLQHSIQSRTLLASRIADAELALQQIIADAQRAIDDMVREQQGLDERILHTRSYLAPIRRLPVELLRDIFECCFEQHACVAWVLSSVCVTWRRLALGLPRIWSKVCVIFPCLSEHEAGACYRGHRQRVSAPSVVVLALRKTFLEQSSLSFRHF